MKKVLALSVVAAAMLLAGCKSAADRMFECESHGVSRDACYVAEQNRQANLNGAAQKQAYENAKEAAFGTGAIGGEQKAKKHHQHHQESNDDDDSEDGDYGSW